MGIELVLRTTKNYKPYLAMRVTCDGCNRLLGSKEAIVCWSYIEGDGIKEQKVLCISKCAGNPKSIIQLPSSRPIGQLEINEKITLF